MSTVIKILLFALIAYFILNWIKSMFSTPQKRTNSTSNVKIFKKGDVEKSSVNIQDAETVEYEEVKEEH